jgi:hypothetical protein
MDEAIVVQRFDPRTVQPVASLCTDWATRPTLNVIVKPRIWDRGPPRGVDQKINVSVVISFARVTKYAKWRIHLCSVMFVRFIASVLNFNLVFCVKCYVWQFAVQQLDLGRHLPLSVTNFCQLYVNIYLLRRGTKHAWELCTHLCLF